MKNLQQWAIPLAVLILIVILAASLAPAVRAGAPTGASPSDPLMVTGAWQTLAPTPTPTPGLTLVNPYATPVPLGTLQGRVLFQDASGGNIYWVNGDGSHLQRITSGLDPALSPDGQWIAFTRWNPPAGVFIAKADGSHEQALISANQPLSPQWSPDGSKIAFVQQKGGTQDDQTKCFRPDFCFHFVADPHFKIGVLEPGKVVDEVVKTPLTEPVCSNHCFSPTWSRDNRTLAYADAQFGILATDSQTDLLQKDLDGKIIHPQPRLLFNQTLNVQSTRYSPDGSQIVFQVKGSNGWNLRVMQAEGSPVVPVTQDDPLGFSFFDSVAPTWSPDGQQILFLSNRHGPWEFYVANTDGSNLRQVLKNVSDAIPLRYNYSNERVMDWSP